MTFEKTEDEERKELDSMTYEVEEKEEARKENNLSNEMIV